MPPLTEILAILAVSWVLWTFFRRRRFPNTLDTIRGPPSGGWVIGHTRQLYHPEAWGLHEDILQTYKEEGVARIKGPFGTNELYIFDPLAMHHVLTKDERIYEEIDWFVEGNKMIFGEGIFTALGDEHRRQRKMLNPVFSMAHMRQMVPIFYEVAHKLRRVLTEKARKGIQEVDVFEWTNRCALELIGQAGLGYSFDELTETAPQHRFAQAAKQLNTNYGHDHFIRATVMPRMMNFGTPTLRRSIVNLMPFAPVKNMKRIINTFYETSTEIFNEKKKAFAAGDDAIASLVGKGKDIISILMKANMSASDEDKMSDELVVSQISSLVFAATDTTSTALARTLFVLAQHKDVQAKLREEIKTSRKNNGGKDIDYDTLVSLPYLDAVCRETLRLYPPVSLASRTASEDVVLPLSKPIKGVDGQDIKEIPIQKGTNIVISIFASNRNPSLWGPDAHEWKPKRWLKPLPEPLISAHLSGVYSHLMTFIGGARSCIGFKFSELEMKVVLVLLLEHLEFSVGDKEIVWLMTGIAAPNVVYDSSDPTMPMKISLAK